MMIGRSLLFGGLALLAVGQDAPLRRPLAGGATELYQTIVALKLDVELPGGGGTQDLAVDAIMDNQLTQGAEKETLDKVMGREIVMKTTIKKLELSGGLSAFLPPPPTVAPFEQKGTLDAKNRLRIEPLKSADMTSVIVNSQINALSNILVELPENAVKDGDEWKILVPKGPFTGKEDQTLNAKLEGMETLEGVPTVKVSIKGPLNVALDGAAVGNGMMSSTGKATVDAIAFVNPKTGETVKMVNTFKTQSTIDPGQGFTVTAKGGGTITTVLKPIPTR